MIRSLKYLSLLLLIGSTALHAQAPAPSSSDGEIAQVFSGPGISSLPDNPVEHARNTRAFHFGPFVSYGAGVGNRSQYHFVSAGMELGKALTPVLPLGPLSGQFELAANVMPAWDAFTPAPHQENRRCTDPDGGTSPCVLPVGGGTFSGVSITPVIFRWNFANHARRFQPWFQGAGGLIYTAHKFPPDVLVPHGASGGTSVWNFTPQGGVGFHWFQGARRSLDFQVNAVHISSASLGDKNPGVNASVWIQAGYTFWR